MRIGYIRVSTSSQDLALQRDAMTGQVDKIFEDIATGSKRDRPGLQAALEFAREGDSIIVWRLDRLGRSMKDLIEIVLSLEEKGIQFKSLHENIDTTSSVGKFIFHMFSAMAEFEKNLLSERTRAGLCAARARGRVGGRPGASKDKLELAKNLYESKKVTTQEICSTLHVGRGTLYRYLNGTETHQK